jgi:hypothetical protein
LVKPTSDLTRRLWKLVADGAIGDGDSGIDGDPGRARFQNRLESEVIP